MADPPLATVTDPAFETALRAKAKDILTTFSELEVSASPVTFTVNDVAISMSWDDPNIQLVIDGIYDIVMPLAWITGPISTTPSKPNGPRRPPSPA